MTDTPPRRPIVSSSHLVSDKGAELSELEFGLMMGWHGFQRWMVRCMAASGHPDLTAMEVMVLHVTNHRDRAKRLADLCLVLNVEDSHIVLYALKKLTKSGLVSSSRQGKERFYRTTPAGAQACADYRQVRETCLMDNLGPLGQTPADLAATAALLRALSGLYDQAARAAASL